MIRIVPVRTPLQLRDARALFLEYASSLGFELTFQDFDREVARLPGDYAPPAGELLIADVEGRPEGCAALRAIDEYACEMKRLYVRPEARGRGVGRLLCESLIAVAQERGYDRMKLDTVPGMDPALALYRSLGFVATEPYRYNPIPGAIYMERVLEARRSERPPEETPR